MTHIQKRQEIGLGKESVAGTKVSATYWYGGRNSGALETMIETVKNDGSFGRIEQTQDVQVAREYAMLDIEGIVSDTSIGLILLATLGATSISGAGPYTHAFTTANTNTHQTLTMWSTDPIGSYSSAYGMVDKFELEAITGAFATFKLSMLGKKRVSESTPSVSYASESFFRARDCKVYLADTEVGLTGATALELNRVRLTIEKNLLMHQNIGEVDIDSFYNQELSIMGDFEANFDAITYQDYVRNATKKRMKIELINTDVTLSGGGNPTLSFTLSRVAFETRSQSKENADVVTETVGFIGALNLTDSYAIKASLKNNRSTAY